MWTHKLGLTRLHFDDLLLPHNIDVMHTEKNVAEALWATLMDTEKSKDNPKALQEILLFMTKSLMTRPVFVI